MQDSENPSQTERPSNTEENIIRDGVRPFGASIMELLEHAQSVQAGGDDSGWPEGVDKNGLHQEVREGLEGIRESLGELSSKQVETLDKYLDEMPPKVRTIIDAPEVSKGLSAWMAQATDEQLVGILTWHGDRLRAQEEDPVFEQEVEVLKQDYIEAIYQAADRGDLHPSVVSEIEDRVAGTKVYKGDAFDLTFMGVAGYHVWDKDYIAINPSNVLDFAGRFVAYHESNHKDIGDLPLILDEPVDDLLTYSYLDGRLDPTRFLESGYSKSSRFVYDLCTLRGALPLRLLTRAYSAQDEESREQTWAELGEAVDDLWAFEGEKGVLDKLVAESDLEYEKLRTAKEPMPITPALEKTGAFMRERLQARFARLKEEESLAA